MQRIRFFSNARRWVTSIALVAVLLVLGALAPTPTHAAPKATFVVTSLFDNTTDDAYCTLREAINAANIAATNANCGANSSADDTITFSVSGIITLGSTLPDIVSGQGTLTINGGGTVTISGATTYRVFVVDSGANLTLQNVTIANGNCGSSCRGGGIYNDGGTATVTNSTFSGNTATTNGGGIYNYGGTVNVTNSTFFGNTATTHGGGIFTYLGTVNVTNSTFSGNSASVNGGGIYNDGGTLTLTNSTFSGNSSAGYGGGIYSNETLTVTNSTFSGNTAPTGGGGIYILGTLTVTNSTFSGNSSAGLGGGIFNNGGTATAKNSIIANNTTGGNCSGTITDGGGNLVWGDATCPGINADPKLGVLASNGGPTQTMKLGPDSAAIDAGNAATCADAATVNGHDQRGKQRDDLQCDIGAYEMQMTDGNWTQFPVALSGSSLTTYGPARAGLQWSESGKNPGVTTVAKVTNWTGGTPVNAIGAWWDISPTDNSTGLDVTLELCYIDSESNSKNLGDLSFWRYSGGVWGLVGAPTSTIRDAFGNNCATRIGVTDLSRWTLATGNPGNPPTSVTLSSFKANAPSFDLGAWFRKSLGR